MTAGIDDARVGAWLEANIDGAVGPFTYEFIGGGRSNLTYLVTDANGARVVLRRPPTGHVLATAHDMSREFRAISAMGRTPVPVPVTFGLCADEAVNDAPFYVMQFIEGDVIDSVDKAKPIPDVTRAAMSVSLIDVLADLHAVDIDEVGLGDFARRDGYVGRQISRWAKQWDASKTRDIDGIDKVVATLAEGIPEQQGVTVVHGDYRFGNTITDLSTGAVRAVLDWELCTLGDPLADIGYLGVQWANPNGSGGRSNDPTGAGGFGSFDDVVEHYAKRSGRDMSNVDYYVAFQSWRAAVILEGVYNRYLHGAMGDQTLEAADMAALAAAPVDLVAQARASLAL